MSDYLDALAEAKGLTSLEHRLVAALRAVEAVFADWEGFDVVDEARTAIRDALEAR